MQDETPVNEIRSLSADDLDVEELEQRLELAAADCPDCYSFGGCDTFCIQPN